MLKSFDLIETEKAINFTIFNSILIANLHFSFEGDELEGNSSFYWFSIKGKFGNNYHIFVTLKASRSAIKQYTKLVSTLFIF